jgi:hypothetical protein
MWGPPKDVEGECNARLEIGDDYGDGTATMRCQMKPGHRGAHQVAYRNRSAGEIVITWEKDARELTSYSQSEKP